MEKTTAVFSRTLGRSGIRVSALGLGCAATGGQFYSTEGEPLAWVDVDDNESIRAIHAALAEGISFFDTADMYGVGHSEEVLGLALKGRRDRVVIATKFGDVMDPVTRRAMGFDARPEFIRQSLEASLRRLNTDYIDLYQFHIWGYPADEAVPVRETLEELAKEGKIRGYAWIWGLSQRTIPIPGFKTVAQAQENARALQFGPLSPEQMMEIEMLLKRQ